MKGDVKRTLYIQEVWGLDMTGLADGTACKPLHELPTVNPGGIYRLFRNPQKLWFTRSLFQAEISEIKQSSSDLQLLSWCLSP